MLRLFSTSVQALGPPDTDWTQRATDLADFSDEIENLSLPRLFKLFRLIACLTCARVLAAMSQAIAQASQEGGRGSGSHAIHCTPPYLVQGASCDADLSGVCEA